MNQYVFAILLLVIAVISEYIYLFWKHGKEKNLAKNIIGDILFIAGMALFEMKYPKSYTNMEFVWHLILSLIYAGTILVCYIVLKGRELQ